jgi:cyclase
MRTAHFNILFGALLLAFCLSLGNTRTISRDEDKGDAELSKLAERVYTHIGSPDGNDVSNSAVVVLEQCVLVYDTHFTPESGQALLRSIQAVTSKPVRYVVNSHFHPDHTHGNQAFSKIQYIISSSNARRDMLQKDQPAFNRMLSVAEGQVERLRKALSRAETRSQKDTLQSQMRAREEFLARMSRLRIVLPTITVDDSLIIFDGTRELRIFAPGPGHTDGDLVLFLPAEKIVFLGDIFFNGAFPNSQDADLLGWTKTLSEIIKLDADKFVPGHGPVGTKKDVSDFLAYLEELKALVEPAVSRGDSMDQVVRDIQIPAKYTSLGFPTFFPANVQKMYAELKSIQMAMPTVTGGEASRKATPEKPRP